MRGMIRPRNKLGEILIHVFAWIVFFGFSMALIGTGPDSHLALMRMALSFLPLIFLFYGNIFFLIPNLLGKKKVVLYVTTLVGLVTLITYIYLWIQQALNAEFYYDHSWFKLLIINRAILHSMLVLTISISLKITGEWYRTEKLKKELENDKLASELAFLKSQVNPHFLFNNLNSIYSLANKKSDDAPKAIVKLSELMRYMLYDSAESQISLDKEVEHLQNYIDLQKLRLNKETHISFNTKGDLESKKIEPVLLEPFVENAFKHSDSYRKGSSIDINLETKEQQLCFRVENSMSKNGQNKDTHSGIGLQNIKRRLKLLYPDRHQLKISQSGEKFLIELKLQLTND